MENHSIIKTTKGRTLRIW